MPKLYDAKCLGPERSGGCGVTQTLDEDYFDGDSAVAYCPQCEEDTWFVKLVDQ